MVCEEGVREDLSTSLHMESRGVGNMSPVTAAPLSEAFRSTEGDGEGEGEADPVSRSAGPPPGGQCASAAVRGHPGTSQFCFILTKIQTFLFYSNQNIDFNLHCFKNLPPT